eukprot:14158145-Alexandrium_andersonii.AAC.1
MGWSWAVFLAQTYLEDALLAPEAGLEGFGWHADSRLIERSRARRRPSRTRCAASGAISTST